MALLAVGAALVVGHLVDLVLPRPQLADGVPRGLVGAVLAVLAGAAVAVLAAGLVGDVLDERRALVHGAVVSGVAALTGLVASYVVVEATATDDEPDGGAAVLPVGAPGDPGGAPPRRLRPGRPRPAGDAVTPSR